MDSMLVSSNRLTPHWTALTNKLYSCERNWRLKAMLGGPREKKKTDLHTKKKKNEWMKLLTRNWLIRSVWVVL